MAQIVIDIAALIIAIIGVYVFYILPLRYLAPVDPWIDDLSEEEVARCIALGGKADRKFLLYGLVPILFLVGIFWVSLHFVGVAVRGMLPDGLIVDALAGEWIFTSLPALFLGMLWGSYLVTPYVKSRAGDTWEASVVANQIRWRIHSERAILPTCLLFTTYGIIYCVVIFGTWVIVNEEGVLLRRMLSLRTEQYSWDEVSLIEFAPKFERSNGKVIDRAIVRFHFANGEQWTSDFNVSGKRYLEVAGPFVGERINHLAVIGTASRIPFVSYRGDVPLTSKESEGSKGQ